MGTYPHILFSNCIYACLVDRNRLFGDVVLVILRYCISLYLYLFDPFTVPVWALEPLYFTHSIQEVLENRNVIIDQNLIINIDVIPTLK